MPRIIPEYKEEVRKKIIDTAYHLFMVRGYHGTTMEEIAGALGVTKPAIYQYFPGKEDLFAAVSERGRQELKGILERSYRDRDFRGGSEALFDSLSRYTPQFYGMFSEMMILAPRNERIRQILEEDRRGDILVIERFIARQQEKGLVPPRLDANTLALASHAIIGGLLLDMSTGLDRGEAKRIWITTVEALLKPS
ncbi:MULTISPECIES: TetR/AcrR family transcriptional regulator [unclassified Methanoregula]|uniref:TetR/AcrR family transcriptional regulator n=1 Tax=unclassified Methanoregula TaxID=2649730 RepID=UPI0009D51A1B|nr:MULTISPECIES: TetR/AcrR family transcriptional regulator [unclassified Methanoregula]OPX64027.1 MAG: DNA-binding transcriptional repressor AcrR [Methanoregula sp. PtaB.Bin085]OPY33775.1 MAG: DNA-binding transcriptional repressor AcrR [Methanoregula sp. PtaU1.Bin006]